MDELHARARLRSLLFLWLMLAITCQIGFAFAYLSGATGGVQFLLFILGCASVGVLGTYWFGDRLVIAATGARVVTAAQEPALHAVVEEIAIAAGLPKPTVAVVEDGSLNAFATGRDPAHSLIGVNRGLLTATNQRQLRGVIAHEMSHILNRDMLVSTAASVMVMAVAGLANGLTAVGLAMAERARVQARNARTQEQRNNANSTAMAGMGIAAIGALLSVTFVPLLALLQLAMGRSRESLADITGAHLCKDPAALAECFELMQASDKLSAGTPLVASALMINEPARARRASLSERVWSSHPPLPDRIATMRSIERGQSYTEAARSAGATRSGVALIGLASALLLIAPSAALAVRSTYVDPTLNVPTLSTDPGYAVPAPTDTSSWYGSYDLTTPAPAGPQPGDLALEVESDSTTIEMGTYEVRYSTSSDGLVTLTSKTGKRCAITLDGLVRLRKPGTCIVEVSQAGDAYTLAQGPLTFTLTILPATQPSPTETENLEDQWINLGDNPSSIPITDGTYDIKAWGSYSHELTYESLTPGTCSVDRGTVSLLDYGVCSILITSPAFYVFSDAQPQTITFTIDPQPASTP